MYFDGKPMESQKTQISLRIPTSLKKLIAKVVKHDTHLNESDFIREAIREKIRRDAPDFYTSLFKELGERPSESLKGAQSY